MEACKGVVTLQIRSINGNYGPISILPVLSKLFERFVQSFFTDYLEDHKLLKIAQSGFRRLHSTVTSLLNVTSRWLKNIDKGLVTGVVFIDLRKAFDTMDSDIMLAKLKGFGSYWPRASVVLELPLSDPLPVNLGVPQGSILGPLVSALPE